MFKQDDNMLLQTKIYSPVEITRKSNHLVIILLISTTYFSNPFLRKVVKNSRKKLYTEPETVNEESESSEIKKNMPCSNHPQIH